MPTPLNCQNLANAVASASANRFPPVVQLALQIFALTPFIVNPNNGGYVYAANYGGNAPNFNPSSSGALALDIVTMQRWTWVLGVGWQ